MIRSLWLSHPTKKTERGWEGGSHWPHRDACPHPNSALAETNKISDQEKDRMINILMVKTGVHLLLALIIDITCPTPESNSQALP